MEFIKKNGIIIAIVIVILVVFVSLFWKTIKKKLKQITKPNRKLINKGNSKNQQPEPKAVFAFFHMENCKFCNDMKPEWNKLMKKGSHNGCKFVEYKAKDNNKLVTKHKIYSFPTLKLCPNGINDVDSCLEFEGKRTADAMIGFIDENL